MFYLPQKPYNVSGSLRQQLTYPLPAPPELTDERVRELLRLVDLEYLIDTHEANVSIINSGAERKEPVPWVDRLSLGETQRLAMARLFYHRPVFAILDECTSAVSTEMEERLYRLCTELSITCITISHRPALYQFHHLKLELDGKGSYTLVELGAHGLLTGSSRDVDSDDDDEVASDAQHKTLIAAHKGNEHHGELSRAYPPLANLGLSAARSLTFGQQVWLLVEVCKKAMN